MGYVNNRIGQKSIVYLCESLSESQTKLKDLALEFSSWGRNIFGNRGAFGDQTIKIICDYAQLNKSTLNNLCLTFSGWGLGNELITDQSLYLLGRLIQKCENLSLINLDLIKWGFKNKKITDDGMMFLL